MFTDKTPITTIKEIPLTCDDKTIEKINLGKTDIAINPEAAAQTRILQSGNQLLIVSCKDDLLLAGAVDVLQKQQSNNTDWREDTEFSRVQAFYNANSNNLPMTVVLVEEDGKINQTNFKGGVLDHSAQLSKPEFAASTGEQVSSGVFAIEVKGSYAIAGGGIDNRPSVMYGSDSTGVVETNLKQMAPIENQKLVKGQSSDVRQMCTDLTRVTREAGQRIPVVVVCTSK
jgi:hypothetical protein